MWLVRFATLQRTALLSMRTVQNAPPAASTQPNTTILSVVIALGPSGPVFDEQSARRIDRVQLPTSQALRANPKIFRKWRGPFLNGFLSGIDRYQPDNQKEFEVEEGVQWLEDQLISVRSAVAISSRRNGQSICRLIVFATYGRARLADINLRTRFTYHVRQRTHHRRQVAPAPW